MFMLIFLAVLPITGMSQDPLAADVNVDRLNRKSLGYALPHDGNNWSVAYQYIENADTFILFDTRHDGAATRHSHILYGTIGNLNDTWNTTSTVVVPRNVDPSDPSDDHGVLEPDLLLEGNTLYCYFTCAQSHNKRGGIAVVAFDVGDFLKSN